MAGTRVLGSSVAAVLIFVVLPVTAWGQQSSGIGGMVRDPSGAVLPGVTVEATSPVLIEKVRSVVTDGEGRYNIVDLRPGTFVVTFSLAGFTTVKREGIVLTAGFTATVDVEMAVGNVAETITVTGSSPLVDVQNVRQQTTVSADLLDALPTAQKSLMTLVTLTPGLGGNLSDVGGSRGAYLGSYIPSSFHGKPPFTKNLLDGMRIQTQELAGGAGGYYPNPEYVEEITLETSGALAESSSSSTVVNHIPKDGGNTFRGGVSGLFTTESLVSDNLSDELRARGLTTVNKLLGLWDYGGTLGGPIRQDTLWFYTAHRRWGTRNQPAGVVYNKTHGTPFYTPDPTRPAEPRDDFRSHALRLTWQAPKGNKISVLSDVQNNYWQSAGANTAAESWNDYHFAPDATHQVTWRLPVTNKLLLDAGASFTFFSYLLGPHTAVGPNDISIVNRTTGTRWNSAGVDTASQGYGQKVSNRSVQRFAASYVTGSHAFKAGFMIDEGYRDFATGTIGDLNYIFLGSTQPRPSAVIQFATPYRGKEILKADLGLFVQDQWTIDRLTLNLGLRFDYFNAYVPEQHGPAAAWLGPRDFGPVHDVPLWKDVNPRVGVSYNLFGNGRTALKAYLGRYQGPNTLNIATANNPMVTSVFQVERTWDDTNGNYVPDCDLRSPARNGECGAFQDQNFGKLNPLASGYADDVLRGFGVRDYFWDVSAEIQHELRPGVSVTGGYYRNWYGNFSVTDNLALSPSDHSPYCITAPVDTQLPGGGGYQVCGLYDIAPSKLGQVTNLVTQASHFGKQTQVNDFFTVTINTRLGSGIQLGGGVDTGRSVADKCFVVDSPQQLLNCRVVTPFRGQTQIKLHGSYPLPAGFIVSTTYQNLSGPAILANYAVRNDLIAPSLGRNLAVCGASATCTASATVPLIVPQTQFEGRRTQLDLRLSKLVNLGRRMRLQANLDLYNALNASSILTINTNYGSAAWRRPTSILPSREIEFGGKLTF
jgi:hypothetical protein